jgi:hypothetical protein
VAVIVYLKSLPGVNPVVITKYNELLKELNKLQDIEYSKQEQSEKETQNWMTLDEISQIRDSYKESSNSSRKIKDKLDFFQMYLVLCLYTKLAPIRNDYANVEVVSCDTFLETEFDVTKNYIELITGKLVLCDYKTNRKFGKKIIDIPSDLLTDIRDWMKLRQGHVVHNKLLINRTDWSPMTRNGLSHFFNKCTGKKVSTTMLRKIYLSERYPVVNTTTEQRSDAFIMSHSIGTQQSIYRKKLSSST